MLLIYYLHNDCILSENPVYRHKLHFKYGICFPLEFLLIVFLMQWVLDSHQC